MSDALQLVVLFGAAMAAMGTIGAGLLWLVKPRVAQWVQGLIEPMQQKVAETHKQVTENHHSNEHPTVLDRIDDVHQEVLAVQAEARRVRDDLSKHVLRTSSETAATSREQTAMWAAIEAIAKASPPPPEPLEADA